MNKHLPMHVAALALLVVGLICSCGQPLPKGAYRVATTELTNRHDVVVRRYQIETGGLRHLCLRHQGGVDSSSLAPDNMTDERTGKAEALVTITLATNAPELVLAMTVTTHGVVARFKQELALTATTDLRALLTEAKMTESKTLVNKTTLLRIEAGGRFLELNIE
ncbi:MAG: hypothetical protein NTY53_14765 [Kiritimatiellaeota bacterium]|nr:hypothetical protein [Kiritimatiellota bacterium]